MGPEALVGLPLLTMVLLRGALLLFFCIGMQVMGPPAIDFLALGFFDW